MRVSDKRRYEVLIRVRNFGATYGQSFPADSAAHEALAAVAEEIDRLNDLDVAERNATQASRRLRKESARNRFEAIVMRAGGVARVLARTHPVFESRFHLPLPKDDLTLIALARQIVKLGAPYAKEFAAHGIPIPEFDEGIGVYERAVQDRGGGRDDTVKTRVEREAAFTRAFAAVDTLDVTVASHLAEDPVAVAMWKHDRRPEPLRRRSKRTDQPTPADAAGRDPQPVHRSLGEGGSGPGESTPAAA